MRAYFRAILAMGLAVLLQGLSLFVFRSLALSFLLYSLVACLLLPLVDLLALRRLSPREALEALGLKPLGRVPILASLAIGFGMAAVIWIAFLILGRAFLSGSQAATLVAAWGIPAGRQGITAGRSAWPYAIGLVANGAIEEVFWRGYMRAILAECAKRPPALLLPALVFGAQHIFVIGSLLSQPWAIALVMGAIACAGLIWAFMLEKTRSLAACMVSHALVAAGYVGVLFVFVL
jgi:hypothetical protein